MYYTMVCGTVLMEPSKLFYTRFICLILSGAISFQTLTILSFVPASFIDEGNAVSGGHGDFKEDETTTLYWACVTAEVDDDAYDL